MYKRAIQARIETAMTDTPVVFLNGPRQTGKTTLARQLVANRPSSAYLTLDDAATLSAATHDPAGFVRRLAPTVVIDEVQKAPGLFPAIKLEVDRDRQPGRFLLTGSANVMLLPRLSESLAGRMEILALWPLSQSELAGSSGCLIDRLFADKPFHGGKHSSTGSDLAPRILSGGFPEAVSRKNERRRGDWFDSYVTAVLQRDLRDLAQIDGLTDMPRLLSLLASRAGGLMNLSEVSRSVGFPHTTLKRYFSLLETTFLIHPVPAWHANLGKRLVKSPKLYLCDTGLLAHLIGLRSAAHFAESSLKGPCVENFVMAELLKMATWAHQRVTLWHFRTSAGKEVDFILEAPGGRLVGIEVKASATLRTDDFRPLQEWAALMKKQFVCGILLYTGDTIIPLGDRLWALPISVLWHAPSC